jgi:23S rRNA U2552 (ribose-2'-O)-methylase RlmE/FtsJ
MANKLDIQINVVDKATATINRINNSVSKMTRPYTNLVRSVGHFSKASGLTQLGKNMAKAASEAGKLASKVGLVAAPMTALVGGGTIAGVYELATSWAQLGAETSRTAETLGVSAQDMNTMRIANQLMGISADTTTSSFRAFADTLQDARWGRNQGAAAMLQYMGIRLHKTKTGAIDAARAMIDFADKVKKVQERDPAAARKLAQSFGVEALMPILQKGGAAMKVYQAEANRLAGTKTPEMFERANMFALSINKMGIAIDGMKNSIGDKLIPVLNPLIDKWTNWIAANRVLIGQKVSEIAERIGRALDGIDLNKVIDGIGKFVNGCIDLAKWVGNIVQHLGGWKTVLIGVAAVMAGSFVASTVLSIAQLVLLIAKLGMAAAAYAGLGTAATTAAAAQSAASGIGMLGKLGLVGAAGAAGYGIGMLANKYVLNPLAGVMSGNSNDTVGSAIYAMTHTEETPGLVGGRAPGSASMSASSGSQAPQVHVHVDTKVDRQGGVHTRVSTPSGVKIAYTSPVMAGM